MMRRYRVTLEMDVDLEEDEAGDVGEFHAELVSGGESVRPALRTLLVIDGWYKRVARWSVEVANG